MNDGTCVTCNESEDAELRTWVMILEYCIINKLCIQPFNLQLTMQLQAQLSISGIRKKDGCASLAKLSVSGRSVGPGSSVDFGSSWTVTAEFEKKME